MMRAGLLGIGGACALALLSCSKPYTDEKIAESISLASSFSKQLDSSPESRLDTTRGFAESLLTLIDDEGLRTLLDIALANNTNILTITSQIAQARENLGLASANMLPKLSINMGYNYSSGNYNRYQININQNTLNGNLSLSWELDLFGKLNMLRKSKKYEYLATLSNLSVAQVSLIGEVASDYYAYRRIASAVRLQEQMVSNYGKILNALQQKHDLGLIDITALSDTISSLNSAKSALNSLLLEQEQMKNALLVLLNTSDTKMLEEIIGDSAQALAVADSGALDSSLMDSSEIDSIRLSELESVLPSARIPSIDALPREILLSRDDVRASIATLNAQVMLKNSKKAALFPTLNLGGSLGQILFSSRGVGDLIWNITGSLATPLINRSALTKDYKIQKESVKQAFYALESTLRTALGEIENAITEVNTAQNSLHAREQIFSTSREVWLATRARYELGLVDESSYLTSYNTLLSARASVDEARQARLSSVIVLYKALGGKLAVEQVAQEATLDSSDLSKG